MPFRHTAVRSFAALLLVAFFVCGVGVDAQRRNRRTAAPRLLVVISIDQMREDITTRFSGYLKHGLKRMRTEGLSFTEAHHDHAVTVTAAGHATLSTGCTPGHTGIVGNDWFDRTIDKKMYCTGDSSARLVDSAANETVSMSPRNLRRTALGDWLQAASPASKVFAIAGKDRSAILMAGQKPDGAFWYNDTSGRFVTSTYYGTSTPKWLDAFNRVDRFTAAFRTGWVRSLDPDDYLISSDDAFGSANDCLHSTFPHTFGPGSAEDLQNFRKGMMLTPFGDEMTLDLAERLIVEERLGTDPTPDILWVGLSCADLIGHSYGPLSQETQDYYVRIDKRIGTFLEFLDRRIGPSGYVVALSSDHGVMPLPEDLARRGYPAKRVVSKDFEASLRTATELARVELGLSQPLFRVDGYEGVYLDLTEVTAKGMDAAVVRRAVAEKVRGVDFLADAYTSDELAAPPSTTDRQYLDLYRRSFSIDRSPDVMVRPKELYLVDWKDCGTSHGTPYRFDTHVPMLFYGAGITAGSRNERVRTIDLAPTLAGILGIAPPPDIDGKALSGVMRGRN